MVGTSLAYDYTLQKDCAPCNNVDDDDDETLLTPLWYTSPIVFSGEIRSMSDVKD
jgi:hypothetical protein